MTESIYHNETFSTLTVSRRNQPNIVSFVLVNPKQIQHAKIIIKHFLARLTGSFAQPITLRLSSSDGGSLASTISEISKIIRAKIMEFAQISGLTASIREYKQILWNSTISKNWFTESLVQGSLLLYDLIGIGEEIGFAINHYFKTYNMTLYEDKDLSLCKKTKSFKFFSTINDAASFSEKLFECLLPVTNRRNPTSSFNLDRALVNLAKDSPDNTVKLFKFRLDQAFIRSAPSNGTTSEQLHMLLCHSLVEKISYYSVCIKELRRFMTCMSSSRDQDSYEAIGHHRFLIKPWLTVIENLSGCKINIGNASINCQFYRRLPKSTTQQVKYIYEKILDQRISRRSPLYRIANKLGNILSRNEWGRQLTYDVCQYFAIFQEGHRKLNTLSKNAAKDKRVAMRYKKLSVSLNIYKNGVLRETILAIRNFHRFVLKMQQFLIHGIRSSFKELWQNHYNILSCLSKWMMKLLELFGCANLSDTDIETSTSTDISLVNITDSDSVSEEELDENNQMRYLVKYSKRDQIRKEADNIFGKLMRLMNHVSKVRSRNHRSTLACLANNLLLVTMFMETISFVSTLFCLGEHKDESNLEEMTESTWT
ncbi:uncharacterized protein [Mycetomoellerius zeteki]|uniref:uncharacterized protein n=1 Tax=Mycetomoellerius zeteki TaxID=64791 RepID=UPI00084E7DD6|nr:PREDICTED: uncharacterized protein LOC108729126 [Trachymyrmex zeteki]